MALSSASSKLMFAAALAVAAAQGKPDVYIIPAEMRNVLTSASSSALNLSCTLPIRYKPGTISSPPPVIEVRLQVQGFANGSAFSSRIDQVVQLTSEAGTPDVGPVGSALRTNSLSAKETVVTVINLNYAIPGGAGVDDTLRLSVTVDSSNSVDEVDEGNNVWSVPMRVSSLGATLLTIRPDLSGTFPYDLPIQNNLEVTLDGPLQQGESIQYVVETQPVDGVDVAVDGETNTPTAAFLHGNVTLYQYTIPLSMGLFERARLTGAAATRSAPVYVWIKRAIGIRTQMRQLNFDMVRSESVLRLTNAARGLSPVGATYDEAAETAASSSTVADPLVRGAIFERKYAAGVRPSPFTLKHTFPEFFLGSAARGAALGTLQPDTWFGGASSQYGIALNMSVSVLYDSETGKLTRTLNGGLRLFIRDQSILYPLLTGTDTPNTKEDNAQTDLTPDEDGLKLTGIFRITAGTLAGMASVVSASGLRAPVPFRLAWPDWDKELRVQVRYAALPLTNMLPLVENMFYATMRFGARGGASWTESTSSLSITGPLFTSLPTLGVSLVGVNLFVAAGQGGADVAAGTNNAIRLDFTIDDDPRSKPLLRGISASYQLSPAVESSLSLAQDTKGTGTGPYAGASGLAVTYTVELADTTAFSDGTAAQAAYTAWSTSSVLPWGKTGRFDQVTRAIATLQRETTSRLAAWDSSNAFGVTNEPFWTTSAGRALENTFEAVTPFAVSTVLEGRDGKTGVLTAPRLLMRSAKNGAQVVNELNIALLPFDAVPGALDTDTEPSLKDYQPDYHPSFAALRYADRASQLLDLQTASPLEKTWGFVAFTRLQLPKFNDGTTWDNGGAATVVGSALNTADVVVAHLSKVELANDAEKVWALPVSNQPVIVNVAATRMLQGVGTEPDCSPLPRAAAAAQATVQRLRYQPNGFEGYPALAVQRIGTGQVSVPVAYMTVDDRKDSWEQHMVASGIFEVSSADPVPQGTEVDTVLGASPCCAAATPACTSSFMPCNILSRDAYFWRIFKAGSKDATTGVVSGTDAQYTLTFTEALTLGAVSDIVLVWAIPPLVYKLQYSEDGTGAWKDVPGASIDVTRGTPAPVFALGTPQRRTDTFLPGTEAAGTEWTGFTVKRLRISITRGWPGTYRATPTAAVEEQNVAYGLDHVTVSHTAVLPQFMGVVAYIKDTDNVRFGTAPWTSAQLHYSKWSESATRYVDRDWTVGAVIPPLSALFAVDRPTLQFAAAAPVALMVVPTSATSGTTSIAQLQAVSYTPVSDTWSARLALAAAAGISYRGVVVLPAQATEAPRQGAPAGSAAFHVAAIAETMDASGTITAQGVHYWIVAVAPASGTAPSIVTGPTQVISGRVAQGLTSIDLTSTDYGIVLAAVVRDHVVISELYLAPRPARGDPLPPSTVYSTGLVWSEPVTAVVPLGDTQAADEHMKNRRLSSVRVSQVRRVATGETLARPMRGLLLEYALTSAGAAATESDKTTIRPALAVAQLAIENMWILGLDGQSSGFVQVQVLVSNSGAARSAPARLEVYAMTAVAAGASYATPAAGDLLDTAVVPEIPAGGNWTVVVPVLVSAWMRANLENGRNDVGVMLKYAKEDIPVLTSAGGAYSVAIAAADAVSEAYLPACTLGLTPATVHPLVGVTFSVVNQGICTQAIEFKHGAGLDPATTKTRRIAPFSSIIETVTFADFASDVANVFTVRITTRDSRDGLTKGKQIAATRTKRDIRGQDSDARGLPTMLTMEFAPKQLYIPTADGVAIQTDFARRKTYAAVRVVNIGKQGLKASVVSSNIEFPGLTNALRTATASAGCGGSCVTQPSCTFLLYDGAGVQAPLSTLDTTAKCGNAELQPGERGLFFFETTEMFESTSAANVATVRLKSSDLQLFVAPAPPAAGGNAGPGNPNQPPGNDPNQPPLLPPVNGPNVPPPLPNFGGRRMQSAFPQVAQEALVLEDGEPVQDMELVQGSASARALQGAATGASSRFSAPGSPVSVTMAWDGAPAPAIEVKAEVRPNAGPSISGITGARTNIPNGGGTTTDPMVISISGLGVTGQKGLAGIAGVDIFVGGANKAGVVTMAKTKAKLFEKDKDNKFVELKDDAAIMAWMGKQTALDGVYTVNAQIPPGQGEKQPIIVSRRETGQLFPRESLPSEDYHVTYRPTVIDGYQVVVGGTAGNTQEVQTPLRCSTAAPTIVRFVGQNLGTPSGRRVRLGFTKPGGLDVPVGGSVLPQSSVLDCSGTVAANAFTCAQFTCPAGQPNTSPERQYVRLEVAGVKADVEVIWEAPQTQQQQHQQGPGQNVL